MNLITIILATLLAASPHDLTSLSQWGPYSKEYYGISHIDSLGSNTKVEFMIVPGQGQNIRVPSALYVSDTHPWKISPDLKHICYRQEIEWKDRVYVDATYHLLDSCRVLVEMKCVNNTDLTQKVDLRMAVRKCTDPDFPEKREIPLEELVPSVDRNGNSFILKYPGIGSHYAVACNFPSRRTIEWQCGRLEHLMPVTHNKTLSLFKGDGKGHFLSNQLDPATLKPHSDTTLYQLIVQGDKEYVEEQVKEFSSDERAFVKASLCAHCTERVLPEASKYSFGKQIIEAALLSNVVYPINAFGLPIRHFCPGKCWNSLYTWDCGFIAWGMACVNPALGYDILRQYTTDPSEPAAFVHHGTPLAIQIFAIGDVLAAGNCDEGQMREIYPRLKRFYDYMTGPDFRLKSGLLTTWKLFYNSGGWDDYPPQHLLRHKKAIRALKAPMVSGAYYIRCARILRLLASHLGLKADVKSFDKDIASFSKAILDNAWDPETGYFGYVEHDADGKPVGLFRTPDGTNFNMGMDGVTPLVAGIGSKEQTEAMLGHLFTPGELWCDCGITVVDRRAPYFQYDGYPNGTVWMPHQLIFWKTMLDMGRPELARRIAFTALDIWEKECEYSYNSVESFDIRTGRGGGWFNFSGLSTPIVNWYHSYFVPGTLTTGFGALLSNPVWASDFTEFNGTLEFEKAGENVTVLAVMAPGHSYKVTVGGKEAAVSSPYDGLLEISFKTPGKQTKLKINKL